MTNNVLLNETGTEPIRLEDEYFILKRNDISYRILLESKTQYTGEGYLILTSKRLVIFPKKQNTSFRAIEIPLNQIYQEEFKQPLFGKNYLTGKCTPIFASPFGAFTFTIWLKGNRMGTLIGAFYTLLDSLRNNQGKNHDQNVIKSLKENNFNELFAIDPEDNSFIYQIQPPSANIPKQNYQSVIINRQPNINNFNNFDRRINNNIIGNNNISQLNDEQMKRNNDIYMSQFIYRNPNDNNQNRFVYKDPGFVYRNPNNININYINNSNDDDDLESPYIPKGNNINNNINNRINNIINNNFSNNINNNRNNIINNNINNIYRNNINNYVNNNRNNIINNNFNNNNRNNDNEIQNPYLPGNNLNNVNSQNQLIRNNPSNYINNNNPPNNPNLNQSNVPQNIVPLNQNNQNNYHDNINISNYNHQNQINNPYGQIINMPLDNKKEKSKNNVQYKNVSEGPLPGKYQNLKEENDNQIIMGNENNSINSNNYEVDSSNIHLENNQDENLLKKLNSDDIIPDSNVENPYE